MTDDLTHRAAADAAPDPERATSQPPAAEAAADAAPTTTPAVPPERALAPEELADAAPTEPVKAPAPVAAASAADSSAERAAVAADSAAAAEPSAAGLAVAPAPEAVGAADTDPKPKRAIPRPGPRVWGVVRWAVAILLCLGVGAGTAFGVMAPARTDVPGLGTPADGRYTYPALQLPALPPAAVGPSAGGGPSGAPGGTVVHAADTRQLLLPEPVGGVADSAYPGAKGWVPLGDYTKLFTDPSGMNELMAENGARHVAATGWRMPDGTHVAVYLLAFRSGVTCQTALNGELLMRLAAAPEKDLTGATDFTVPAGVANALSRPAGHAGPAVRAAIFSNEDLAGLLVMTNPKAVNPVDFDQALTLQLQLLAG